MGRYVQIWVRNLSRRSYNLRCLATKITLRIELAKKNIDQTPDRRSIIVKFCRRDCKRSVISASRKTKDSGIFVNECLTPVRKSIFNALLAMKRSHPDLVKGCATFDGRVFAFTKPAPFSPAPARDQRHLISSFDGLRKFCCEYVKKPLDSFLESPTH